jgi:uncharacterized protein (DUF1330 family)
MAKAYWVAHVEVHDPERYRRYVEEAAPAFREFNARFLARGGKFELLEAEGLGSRHVIIEFEDMDKAKSCYHCATYQKALQHRLAASTGKLMIVEGVE